MDIIATIYCHNLIISMDECHVRSMNLMSFYFLHLHTYTCGRHIFLLEVVLKQRMSVPVSLTQWVKTMHNICKVGVRILDTTKKKKNNELVVLFYPYMNRHFYSGDLFLEEKNKMLVWDFRK